MPKERSHNARLSNLDAARRLGAVSPDAFTLAVEQALQVSCSGCQELLPEERPTRLDELSDLVAAAVRQLDKFLDEDDFWDTALDLFVRWRRRYGRKKVSVELAAALLVKARDELPGDPARSGRWARLAAVVAGWKKTPAHRERLAQALAYMGNAVRAKQTEGLAAAEPWFGSARVLLRRGVGSVEVGAEVDRLQGTLSKDRRRFGAAVHLFQRSIAWYAALGDRRMVARTALSLGLAHFYAGRLDRARDVCRIALAWSAKAGEDGLRFTALAHLASYAESAGDLADARALLGQALTVEDRHLGPTVAQAIGSLDLLLAVQEGVPGSFDRLWTLYEERFADGCPYTAIGLLVDMARVSHEQRFVQEVPRIADEVARLRDRVPEHYGKVREAFNSLQQAVLEQALPPALALRFTAYFVLARRDPTHSWVRRS